MLSAISSHSGRNLFSLKNILTFAAGIIFGICYAYLRIGAFRWRAVFSKSSNTLLPIVYEVDRSFADYLSKQVRVLCWIVTSPGNEIEAKAVKSTWGRRCDILLFTSTEEDKDLPAITLNMTGDAKHLAWARTKKGFSYIYENYLDKADWFIKLDTQNYVIMENLKYMLHDHSADDPVYFGRKFFKHLAQGYMSGGAGYVLSRESLRRFVEKAMPVPSKCRNIDSGMEDVELGICLENVGVVAGNSMDNLGRGRFFPFDPATHIVSGLMDDIQWYWEYIKIPYQEEIDCCSDTTIAFDFVFPDTMYTYEYLFYRLNSRLIN